jgi:DnaJ-class molecular chaperone
VGIELDQRAARCLPRLDASLAPRACSFHRKASADVIRKAYLQLSMKNHPDKNPGDEAAKRRFQQISEAYQVLSDPKLRSKYDATGSVDGIDFEDAAAVFTQLFGSPKFDVYIGRLRLASMILLEGNQDALIAYEKQRLADLVLNLKVIIQQYTLSSDLDMFVCAMSAEAASLAKEQHGGY